MQMPLGFCIILMLVTRTQTQNSFASTGPKPIHKSIMPEISSDENPPKALTASMSLGINNPEHKSGQNLLNPLPLEDLQSPSVPDESKLPSSSPLSPPSHAGDTTPTSVSTTGTVDSIDEPHKAKTLNLKQGNNITDDEKISSRDLRIPNPLASSTDISDQDVLIRKELASESPILQQTSSKVPLIRLLNSSRTATALGRYPQATNVPSSRSMPKPLGSLYVDTVNTHSPQQRSVGVGSIPPCLVEDLENNDLYKLSSSQFGYPRSIVNKALRESNAKMIFDALEEQLYLSSRGDVRASHDDQVSSSNNFKKPGSNEQLQNVFPPVSGFHQSSPINSLFQRTLSNNDLQFGKQTNLLTGTDSSFKESPEGPKFHPTPSTDAKPSEFLFDARNGLADTPAHLLEGSSFQGQSEPSIEQERDSYVESTVKGHDPHNDRAAADTITTNQGVSSFNEDEKTITSSLPEPRTALSQEPTRSRFSNRLPDVSSEGSASWFSANIQPQIFTSFDSQPTTQYNSNIGRLFPPRSSNDFLSFSSSNDFGRSNFDDSFIKYSPDTSSSVSSPFQLDTKSLFSSISGVSVEEDGRPTSKMKPSGIGASPFQPGSGIFSSPNGVKLQRGSPVSFNDGSQESRYKTPFKIRKKRQVRGSPREPKAVTESTCPVSYQLLRQYTNHGGPCFVVKPEVQGIQFASCINSECRGCSVASGSSRCQAVRMPMWVWSYCEQGQSAGKVAAERLLLPVVCTCRVTQCQRTGR